MSILNNNRNFFKTYFPNYHLLNDDNDEKSQLLTDEIEKVKIQIQNKKKQLEIKENKLTEKYLSIIEQAEFFRNPLEPEIKELINKAKEIKKNYCKLNEKYYKNKICVEHKKEQFNWKFEKLNEDDKELYNLIKEIIDKNSKINKSQILNKNISNNKLMIYTLKNKSLSYKRNILKIENELEKFNNESRDELKNDTNSKNDFSSKTPKKSNSIKSNKSNNFSLTKINKTISEQKKALIKKSSSYEKYKINKTQKFSSKEKFDVTLKKIKNSLSIEKNKLSPTKLNRIKKSLEKSNNTYVKLEYSNKSKFIEKNKNLLTMLKTQKKVINLKKYKQGSTQLNKFLSPEISYEKIIKNKENIKKQNINKSINEPNKNYLKIKKKITKLSKSLPDINTLDTTINSKVISTSINISTKNNIKKTYPNKKVNN